MLVFMSKIRVKARLTSLHCSQGYRFSVEPNVKFVILRAFKLGHWRTQKIFMGRFQSAKIFLCTKIESMIRKNIKQAAIQYVNVVKQL